MAKKFGKAVVFTAVAAAVAAGGMAIYNKYKVSSDDFDDDDLLDFDDDDDDDFDDLDLDDDEDEDEEEVKTEDNNRDYVTIPKDTESDAPKVNLNVKIADDKKDED